MKRLSSVSTKFITASLAFAMLGLMVAQALLVRDSLQLSEQLFRQQVQESLSSVARKLEDAEHVADAVYIASEVKSIDQKSSNRSNLGIQVSNDDGCDASSEMNSELNSVQVSEKKKQKNIEKNNDRFETQKNGSQEARLNGLGRVIEQQDAVQSRDPDRGMAQANRLRSTESAAAGMKISEKSFSVPHKVRSRAAMSVGERPKNLQQMGVPSGRPENNGQERDLGIESRTDIHNGSRNGSRNGSLIEPRRTLRNDSRSWDSVLQQMSGEFSAAFSDVEERLEETVRAMTSTRFVFDRPSVDPLPSAYPDVQISIGYGNSAQGGVAQGSVVPNGSYGSTSAFSVVIGNPESMQQRRSKVLLPPDNSRRLEDRQQNPEQRVHSIASTNKGNRTEEYTRRARTKISHIQQTVRDLREFTRALDERVSVRVMDSVITAEFSQRNLPVDYAFGVLDGKCSKFIYTKNGVAEDLQVSPFKTVLFPGDIVQKNHTLVVNFPTKTEYIVSKNAGVLGSSLIFMAIIVGSFGWTMRNLNRHKKISEMKSDFINNMTHELKTPITTIELAADALRDPDVSASSDRVQRFLGVIREENYRLRTQVERVLQAAKMERGELVLATSMIDMNELINKSVDAIRLQLESRGGELTTDMEATLAMVAGDEMHLRNVVLNLLDNAIKYSTESPRITVRSYNAGTRLCIEVADSGIGISKDNQKRVFERLYRVPTGNVHNVKGFGLGLSYVQSIVEAHGGMVSVSSELGKGSTFIVTLPLRIPDKELKTT